MPRREAEPRVATARAGRGGRGAPAWVRAALLTVLAAVAVTLISGPDGFWLSVPCALMAASTTTSTRSALAAAASLELVCGLVVGAGDGGRLPSGWLMLLVPLGSVLVLDRVSRRLQSDRDAMERAAFSDPLTGLANRRMLMSMAEYELARHRRVDARFVTVMIDLDGFKALNDRYGHAAGDELLCDVAGALTEVLRSQDTVARLGGDEFCVIAPETENPRALAQKVVAAVEHAARGRGSLRLRASVGVSVYPEDGTNMETLLEVADSRLLAAKRRLYEGADRRPRRGAERVGQRRAERAPDRWAA